MTRLHFARMGCLRDNYPNLCPRPPKKRHLMSNQASQQIDHVYHEKRLLLLLARRPDLSTDPVQTPAFRSPNSGAMGRREVIPAGEGHGTATKRNVLAPFQNGFYVSAAMSWSLNIVAPFSPAAATRRRPATLPEACQQLNTERFNLVIVSSLDAQGEGDFLASIPVETKTLVLNGLIFPKELLAAVSDRLPDGRRAIAVVR